MDGRLVGFPEKCMSKEERNDSRKTFSDHIWKCFLDICRELQTSGKHTKDTIYTKNQKFSGRRDLQ